MKIEWHDGGREPQCPPDPAYPTGKDVLLVDGIEKCATRLPYPARRCGYFTVKCERCGAHVAVTTAGRPDDPRSVEIPCLVLSH